MHSKRQSLLKGIAAEMWQLSVDSIPAHNEEAAAKKLEATLERHRSARRLTAREVEFVVTTFEQLCAATVASSRQCAQLGKQ